MKKREIEIETVKLVSGINEEGVRYARFDVIMDEEFRISNFLNFDVKRLFKRQMQINFEKDFVIDMNVKKCYLVFEKTKFQNYIGLEVTFDNLGSFYTHKFKVTDAEIAELKYFYKGVLAPQSNIDFDSVENED